MTPPDSFESWWNSSPWLDLKAEHSSEETKAIAKQTARSAWLARGKLDASLVESNGWRMFKPEHATAIANGIRKLDHE